MGDTRAADQLDRVLLQGTDPGRLRIGKRTLLGIEFTSFIRGSAFLFHDANENSPSLYTVCHRKISTRTMHTSELGAHCHAAAVGATSSVRSVTISLSLTLNSVATASGASPSHRRLAASPPSWSQ